MVFLRARPSPRHPPCSKTHEARGNQAERNGNGKAGRIEIRPTPKAPTTLAGDLAQKLLALTGQRWAVTISREQGEPTLSEQKLAAKAAKFESVTQEPLVRAVLDRFPGAEIKEVRRIAEEDIAAPMPDDDA